MSGSISPSGILASPGAIPGTIAPPRTKTGKVSSGAWMVRVLRAIERLARPEIGPPAGGQVNAAPIALIVNRRNEQPGTQHVLQILVVAVGVRRERQRHGSQHR